MTERVILYSKEPDETGGCPFCVQAKLWLQGRGIPFTELSLGKAERAVLYDGLELTGSQRTVPQIVVVDEVGGITRIGGFSDLESSGLESLFA